MARVDVIVPCYNYGRFLHHCVNSALGQVGVDVRVLIIDDASRDNTKEVATSLAKDGRVTFIRHRENKGHIATYNESPLERAPAENSLLISADHLTSEVLASAVRDTTTLVENEKPAATDHVYITMDDQNG